MTDCEHEADHTIRVALCGLPTMLEEIVSRLVNDVDGIRVVARLDPSADLAEDFERSNAHVLICALGEDEMGLRWRDCVQRRPLPAVLNLGADARDGHVYALRAYDHPLDALSAASLLDALHALTAGRVA